jgi:hypothetical protein
MVLVFMFIYIHIMRTKSLQMFTSASWQTDYFANLSVSCNDILFTGNKEKERRKYVLIKHEILKNQ